MCLVLAEMAKSHRSRGTRMEERYKVESSNPTSGPAALMVVVDIAGLSVRKRTGGGVDHESMVPTESPFWRVYMSVSHDWGTI